MEYLSVNNIVHRDLAGKNENDSKLKSASVKQRNK